MTAPQLYLRRCNGHPVAGITVSRATVASVLAMLSVSAATITGDLDTGLTVRVAGRRPWECETPGTIEREFTYEPLPAGSTARGEPCLDADV